MLQVYTVASNSSNVQFVVVEKGDKSGPKNKTGMTCCTTQKIPRKVACIVMQ